MTNQAGKKSKTSAKIHGKFSKPVNSSKTNDEADSVDIRFFDVEPQQNNTNETN